MKKIVLATQNRHKVREIKKLLRGLGIKVLTLDCFPGAPEVVEDGKTLEENAAKKARETALYTDSWALADDTGLEVKYLGGKPGVYSARWAGPGCSYHDNNVKLLRELKNARGEKRKAVFKCVMALSDPSGKVKLAKGGISGVITENIRGKNGFGYDPVFYIRKYRKTFAEMPLGLKNRISHRGRALGKAKKLIMQRLAHSG
ncbi:MAG: XTP/dITP diphosphatase [Endomicrobiales bacterium]|nr:XTP/dITP diphosphatase [Endomicrobiales bacterium]